VNRVLLVSDDNTRLTPAERMIPPLLERLNRAGIPDQQIACIMGARHPPVHDAEEMQAKVGPAVYRRIRVSTMLARAGKPY